VADGSVRVVVPPSRQATIAEVVEDAGIAGRDSSGSNDNQAFSGDAGEMAVRIAAFVWTSTLLGARAQWPASLEHAVRLMLASRQPIFIGWGQDLLVLHNDAFASVLGAELSAASLGRPAKECWPELWPLLEADVDLVMRGEASLWREHQPFALTRFGHAEQLWWTYSLSPIDAEDGVGGVLAICNDVTQDHVALKALGQANVKLSGDLDRLKDLFAQAPGFVAVLRGPDHVFEFTNPAYDALVGLTGLVGRTVEQALPEVREQGFIDLLDDVFASSEPHVGREVPLRIESDGRGRDLFVDFVYQPIRDLTGSVAGIFVQGSDVTERVRAVQRQGLLLGEANHRIKNLLATMQALVALSGDSSKTVEEYRENLEERLRALIKTQEVLSAGHMDAVDAKAVIEAELAPYQGMGERLSFTCDDLLIPPHAAVSLGLIVHELLTNAVKYGALGAPEGRLNVACRVSGQEASLEWSEAIGLEQPPAPEGFGFRLVRQLSRHLGGQADIDLQPTGLKARVTFKLIET
jgi:two-component sensor histidine kinase